MVILIVIGELGTVPKGLVIGIGRVRNRRTSRDHPNYSIAEIGQNTGKSPGDLKRFVVKMRTCTIVNFAVPVDHRVKLKESEKNYKYLDFARELKKTMEHESNGYINCNGCSWYCHIRIGKRTRGF